MKQPSLWSRFQTYYLAYPNIGFTLDISRMKFEDSFLETMEAKIAKAYEDQQALEKGAIANPDENRQVGHYWLRNPSLAPTPSLQKEIEETLKNIEQFTQKIHQGEITSAQDRPFKTLLLIGIGGSALGPQLVADALGTSHNVCDIYFLDNTDPNGFDRIFEKLKEQLNQTLVLVISKSGGTKETRNGMLETQRFFESQNLSFAKQAVAITGAGSELDHVAVKENWLARFPMWDWVGGRTSVMSAVGLLPAALQGFSIRDFLAGASAMDTHTRLPETRQNAAMLLALMWYYAGKGRGEKDMVILPYSDQLSLFSKYLQQLIMESLGKENDLEGKQVNQGIAVYGNKGATDQHAYVQQLREGLNNFFVTFIEVRQKRTKPSLEIEPGITSGDYLNGFLRGTRQALYEKDRESITLSIPEVNAFQLGVLIALYERAVGFYASLVNINAYHQPGVEAGKKAATRLLSLQQKILKELPHQPAVTPATLASQWQEDPEEIYHLLIHLASNGYPIQIHEASAPGKTEFTWNKVC